VTKRTKTEGETRVESEDWPTFFTMVPEWVTFAPISDRAHRIYTVLAAHLRRDTGSRTTGVIVQADLAAVVGLSSNPERVRRYIGELEDLGAVRVIEEWDAIRKIPITRYLVRFNPPPGYTGHLRVQSWQEERRAARDARIAERREKEARRKGKNAGQPVTLKDEGHEPRKVEGHGPRKNEGPSTDEPHPYETSSDDTAPSARSAVDVRRTSTSGSSAHDAASGSAAAGKAGSSTGKGKASGVPVQRDGDAGKLTREQVAAVRAVEALLPPLLARELPYGHIPNRNRGAVLEALESRTLDQLRERIARRWVAYGYEPAIHDGELRSAIGAALELIIPSRYCPDPACEDGTLIDTGADCRACTERKAKRLADRLAGNTPSASKGRAAAPTCDVCERPFPGEVPADLLCKPCRAEIERANSRFASGPAAEETDRQEREEAARREAEELEQEAQRRRARRATDAATAAPAVKDVDPAEAQAAAEEDARIRAELLAAHPWMADYAQEPAARQGPAPF
jgi:hypothetical protein